MTRPQVINQRPASESGSSQPAGGQPGADGGQLMLGGMPRRLFTATPSRLASFDCPRRYRMAYLDRPQPPKGPPWAHNTLGAAVHVALARWWQLAPGARTSAAGRTLVTRAWQHDGFRDEEQSAAWRDRAADWVEEYLREVDADDPPVGVERTVAVRTERLALSGRVDRIDDRPGPDGDDELVIVDYKTGRHVPSDQDAKSSQALAVYVLAARRTLRRACATVELHHLPSGTVARARHTTESLERHVARAEAVAQDIEAATDTLASGAAADDVFPARTGPGCSWCDFRRSCPEGRAASQDRLSWSGLADPV